MWSLMHRDMWTTPLATGPRFFPRKVHSEGGNCGESRRVQAMFTWETESPVVYQFRVDEAPYPWQETHLKEGKLRAQARLEKRWAPLGFWSVTMIRHMKWQPILSTTVGLSFQHLSGENYYWRTIRSPPGTILLMTLLAWQAKRRN